MLLSKRLFEIVALSFFSLNLKIKISICKIKDNISFQGRLRYAVMGRIFYKDFKTLIKENISKSNTSVKNMFVPAQGASRPYFVIAQRKRLKIKRLS